MKRSSTLLSLSLSISLMAGAISCGTDQKDVITGGTGGASGTGGSSAGTGGTSSGTGGNSAGTGGTNAGTGGAGPGPDGGQPDAMTNAIWNPATASRVSVQQTSGFSSGGSFCFSYNVEIATKKFEKFDCSATVPIVSRVLTTAEFATLDASLAKVTLTTQNTCGADKGVYALTITTTDAKMHHYKDSFYSCQGGTDPYVDNIDQLVQTMQTLAM